MCFTGSFHVPTLRVTAIAATTDIGLQPSSVTFMIRVVKAVKADDAGRVFLAIFALPGHISMFQYFGADAKRQVVVPDLGDDPVRIIALEEELFSALEIVLNRIHIASSCHSGLIQTLVDNLRVQRLHEGGREDGGDGVRGGCRGLSLKSCLQIALEKSLELRVDARLI